MAPLRPDVSMVHQSPSRPTLVEVAMLARRGLEPGLDQASGGQAISAGACLHASILLAVMLQRFGPWHVEIRGGGDGCAGARDTRGVLRGHYWAVAFDPSGESFVVDITADQFGYAPVEVIPSAQAAGRYVAGPQEDVDRVVAEEASALGCEGLVLAGRRRQADSEVQGCR